MDTEHPSLPGKPLLVLGMHRSGTSFLASALQSMGVHIGDDLLPGNEGNPRGHFEATSVLDFHLRALVSRAEDRTRFPDGGIYRERPLDFTPTDDELKQAQNIVGELARPGFWGWKEPRTCLFLPFWFDLLPLARGVVVYRHPLEVFVSLVRRKDWEAVLQPAMVFNTYATYNEALLKQIEATPERMLVLSDEAFGSVSDLQEGLGLFLGEELKGTVAQFHPDEYKRLSVGPRLHQLLERFHPRAMAAFEGLQRRARMPRKMIAEDSEQGAPILSVLEEWAESRDAEALQELHPLLETLVPEVPEGFFHHQRQSVLRNIRQAFQGSAASLEEMVTQRDTYIEKFNEYYTAYTSLNESFEGGRKWSYEVLLPRIRQLETWLWDLGYDPETGERRTGDAGQ